jgi:ParB/Sulfiredoxin domain
MPETATRVPGVIPQRYEDEVPLAQLHPHPANPNAGDVGLLATLIDANGFATPVLAQEGTGIIIDGEHRWIAAGQRQMRTLPVVWLDVDDDTRDRLLASLNESTRRGRNDEEKLVALLTGLASTPKGLAGTAFDGDDLDELIAGLAGDGSGDRPDRGDLLALAGVTLGEPRHQPQAGQAWTLGAHVLVVADVYTGWPLWAPYLAGDAVFLPYPTPLLPHSENLPGPLVLVQPETYLAGHLLDKWQDITGEAPQLQEAGST